MKRLLYKVLFLQLLAQMVTAGGDLINFISPEEIDSASKNRAGKGDVNVNVEPGSSVPFMIIFENLQDNLGEFIVEAVSSSPGK